MEEADLSLQVFVRKGLAGTSKIGNISDSLLVFVISMRVTRKHTLLPPMQLSAKRVFFLVISKDLQLFRYHFGKYLQKKIT